MEKLLKAEELEAKTVAYLEEYLARVTRMRDALSEHAKLVSYLLDAKRAQRKPAA
jgi:hypothetical protein